MDPESQAEGLNEFVQRVVGVGWLSSLITALLILLVTAIIARVFSRFLRHVLMHDSSPLPSSSIFINIARVMVWGIGLSTILATCFNVDVSAAVTALGIGGIAVSLGFQDTLSNLIGGLQVSITGLVKPGDHVEVGGQRGVVRDVTWRHTSIENVLGERIVIPNSVINKNSLVKLRPPEVLVVTFVLTLSDRPLDEVAASIEHAANEAACALCPLEKPARVFFSEVTDYGYKATVTLTLSDSSVFSAAKDAVVRAIAPYTHENTMLA